MQSQRWTQRAWLRPHASPSLFPRCGASLAGLEGPSGREGGLPFPKQELLPSPQTAFSHQAMTLGTHGGSALFQARSSSHYKPRQATGVWWSPVQGKSPTACHSWSIYILPRVPTRCRSEAMCPHGPWLADPGQGCPPANSFYIVFCPTARTSEASREKEERREAAPESQ